MNNGIPVKILFLAADPSDASRLRLGQELRDIKERLRIARDADKYQLEQRESVRVEDITQAIFDVNPQIIHFSGHGKTTEELGFENKIGQIQPVEPEALAAMFGLFEQVECVLLNACYSEIQAKAIAEHISFVIGMNDAIGDAAAIAFAVGFYKALERLFNNSQDEGKTSPLAGICQEEYIKPWDKTSAIDFINSRLALTSVSFTEAEIMQIIRESGGHPRKLMQLCYRTYSRYTEGM